MYLSNRDIKWAIECGDLIVVPAPEELEGGFDETSFDLHLGSVKDAKIWDVEQFKADQGTSGIRRPEINLGTFRFQELGAKYLINPPEEGPPNGEIQPVCCRGRQVIVRPGGFLLWVTKEEIGTPKENPRLIAFVNAKSTRARTGLMVHLTAPTIHSGWKGNITLEIANLGPFDFILEENAVIAQLTVATISSPPKLALRVTESQTQGQTGAEGRPAQE